MAAPIQIPSAFQTTDPKTREDLRRIRIALEQLAARSSGSSGDAHAASHMDGGDDEINVDGLTGVLADPQRADTLVADGPVDLDVGSIADGQYLIRNGSAVVGTASPVAPVFWAHRTGSEHADSDEFEAGSLGANWSLRRTDTMAVVTAAGEVDPTVAAASITAPRFSSNYRSTFAALQPADHATSTILARKITSRPDNLHFRARVSLPYQTHVGGSGGSTGGLSAFLICQDNAGVPSFSNMMRIGWVLGGSNGRQPFAQHVSGGTPVVEEFKSQLAAWAMDSEFIITINNLSDAAVWIRNEGGSTRLATANMAGVAAGDPLWVAWQVNGNGNGSKFIWLCDYILQQNDIALPF